MNGYMLTDEEKIEEVVKALDGYVFVYCMGCGKKALVFPNTYRHYFCSIDCWTTCKPVFIGNLGVVAPSENWT